MYIFSCWIYFFYFWHKLKYFGTNTIRYYIGRTHFGRKHIYIQNTDSDLYILVENELAYAEAKRTVAYEIPRLLKPLCLILIFHFKF